MCLGQSCNVMGTWLHVNADTCMLTVTYNKDQTKSFLVSCP